MLYLLNPRLSEQDCAKLMAHSERNRKEVMESYAKHMDSFKTDEEKSLYAKMVMPILAQFMFLM